MRFIGKINKEIYKCVTDNIVTDNVIITDERIEHIKSHHPNDYENSIMSFWHIGETTWRKTLKNKKILYKRE